MIAANGARITPALSGESETGRRHHGFFRGASAASYDLANGPVHPRPHFAALSVVILKLRSHPAHRPILGLKRSRGSELFGIPARIGGKQQNREQWLPVIVKPKVLVFRVGQKVLLGPGKNTIQ